MRGSLFQVLVVGQILAIVYALQKKVAWKVVNLVDDAMLRSRYDRAHQFRTRRRPYPTPQKKNLYYRPEE